MKILCPSPRWTAVFQLSLCLACVLVSALPCYAEPEGGLPTASASPSGVLFEKVDARRAAEVRAQLKTDLSPEDRLRYSTQYATYLAAEGEFRRSLEYTDDCLALLAQQERASEIRRYFRRLKIPVLFAWRQSMLREDPTSALAFDQVITQILLSLVSSDPAGMVDDDSGWRVEALRASAAWMGGRVLEYRLDAEGALPADLIALFTASFTERPRHLEWEKSLKGELHYLRELLRTADGASTPTRTQLLRESNARFLEGLLSHPETGYLASHESLLYETALLPDDLPGSLLPAKGPGLLPLIIFMRESVESNIRVLEDHRARLDAMRREHEAQLAELTRRTKEVEKRRDLLERQAEEIGKMEFYEVADLPALPDFLDEREADKIVDLRNQLGDSLVEASTAWKRLKDARQEDGEFQDKYREQYRNEAGPKQILLKNASDTTLDARLSFYRNGTWYNRSMTQGWKILPGETIRPKYAGSPIVASHYKGSFRPVGNSSPPVMFDHCPTRVIALDSTGEGVGEYTIELTR